MKRLFAIMLAAALLLGTSCAKKELTLSELLEKGEQHLSDGEYDEAATAFSSAIELDDRDTDAYLLRADAYIGLGGEENIQKAIADYETVLKEDDGNKKAYTGLIPLYIQTDELEKAAEVLENMPDGKKKDKLKEQLDEAIASRPKASDEKPAEENKKEDTPKQKPLTVSDALTYSRAAVSEYCEMDHSIVIPQIDGNTETIRSINQKLLDKYGVYAELLQNGYVSTYMIPDPSLEEDRIIWDVSYQYAVYDDTVGILVQDIWGYPGSESSYAYSGFYYDARNDTELDFFEYLDRLGIDFNVLTARLNLKLRENAFDEYYTVLENQYSDNRIRQAIYDGEAVTAVYNNTAGMEYVTTETISYGKDELYTQSRNTIPQEKAAQVLREYYDANFDESTEYVGVYGDTYAFDRGFLCDLDNDGCPELCVRYIDEGETYCLRIFRFTAGQIVCSVNVYKYGGTRNTWYRLVSDGGTVMVVSRIYDSYRVADWLTMVGFDDGLSKNYIEPRRYYFRSGDDIYMVADESYPEITEVTEDVFYDEINKLDKKYAELWLDTDYCDFDTYGE